MEETWTDRLIRAAARRWPKERGRPRMLAEASGVDYWSCVLYLRPPKDGAPAVAQPRGDRMERLAGAVGLTEAELRGIVNGPFMTSSLPSASVHPDLARMEDKMDKEQRAIWEAIGILKDRLNRIESGAGSTKPTPHRPPKAPRT